MGHSPRNLWCAILVAAAAALSPCAASALPATVPPSARDTSVVTATQGAPQWQFTVMPYIWATGMGGTIRPFAGAPVLSIDRSFSEMLSDVDGAFYLSFGAQRERFLVLGDGTYVSTSRQGRLPNGAPARGSTRQTTLTLAGGYRARTELPVLVDLFAGFRAFWLEADVEVAGGVVSASPQRNFVDPLVGGRAILPLSPRWSTMLYADVGGFGVGNELAGVVSGLVNLVLSPRFVASAGYRVMLLDHDDAGTVADLTMQGPILGLSLRF